MLLKERWCKTYNLRKTSFTFFYVAYECDLNEPNQIENEI